MANHLDDLYALTAFGPFTPGADTVYRDADSVNVFFYRFDNACLQSTCFLSEGISAGRTST